MPVLMFAQSLIVGLRLLLLSTAEQFIEPFTECRRFGCILGRQGLRRRQIHAGIERFGNIDYFFFFGKSIKSLFGKDQLLAIFNFEYAATRLH